MYRMNMIHGTFVTSVLDKSIIDNLVFAGHFSSRSELIRTAVMEYMDKFSSFGFSSNPRIRAKLHEPSTVSFSIDEQLLTKIRESVGFCEFLSMSELFRHAMYSTLYEYLNNPSGINFSLSDVDSYKSNRRGVPVRLRTIQLSVVELFLERFSLPSRSSLFRKIVRIQLEDEMVFHHKFVNSLGGLCASNLNDRVIITYTLDESTLELMKSIVSRGFYLSISELNRYVVHKFLKEFEPLKFHAEPDLVDFRSIKYKNRMFVMNE